ncbi:hypothetical protein [Bdellovibrio sp. HCB337]|uniref:hypothetical protein n=1 Tax=Bdellovibrio sp. HCB337 TaxID=3394358 RepID=UPI0039A45433
MSSSNKHKSTITDLDSILNYVDSSRGLKAKLGESGRIQIYQDLDGKVFSFFAHDISEILHRTDADGKPFIQLNMKGGHKVLFTDTLIGFKPVETIGLDISRIPKVVTTPDLLSVFEAIEESMGAESGADTEVEILKKVYFSILSGGEQVGFDLSFERKWLNRLIASKSRACA